jgi:hypothetical protein
MWLARGSPGMGDRAAVLPVRTAANGHRQKWWRTFASWFAD